MIINLNSIIRFLFLSTLFLYPFAFFGHLLFLVPQLLLIVTIILQRFLRQEQLRASPLVVFLIFCTMLVCLTPLLFQGFHEEGSFFFGIKILLNFSMILAVILSEQNIIHEKDIRVLRRFRDSYLLICLLAYCVLSSYEQMSIVLLVFFKNPDSSQLYSIAGPLGYFFITKNVTAMFMISLFAYDLFLSVYYKKKVLMRNWVLWGVLVALFFSRQAILAYLILGATYYLFYASTLKRTFAFGIIALGGLLFFWTFFDLTSKNDGGNQRILLYNLFFDTVHEFAFMGMGQEGMRKSITTSGIDIDNYHLFFMNQIGAYGLFHTLAFNLLLILIFFYIPRGSRKYTLFLMLAYWTNVMFQTYGYEFQNLWLFAAMASVRMNVYPLRISSVEQLPITQPKGFRNTKLQPIPQRGVSLPENKYNYFNPL